jgi:DNA-binding MarR family transcriptional regulator
MADRSTTDCVCTNLRMATRLVSRHYDRALASSGLTVSGYAILVHLDREGPRALGELATRLAMDRSTLSREVAPLIASGLVVSALAGADPRRRILSLSGAGAARLRLARPLREAARASLEDDFGAVRAAELVAELQALLGVMP